MIQIQTYFRRHLTSDAYKERYLLRDGLFVHLENMNHHPSSSRELLVADMALEVLSLLMLNQDLLVLKLPLAIITPHLERLLLFLPHPVLPQFPQLTGESPAQLLLIRQSLSSFLCTTPLDIPLSARCA